MNGWQVPYIEIKWLSNIKTIKSSKPITRVIPVWVNFDYFI